MKETADKFTVLTTGKIETVISKMAIPTIISMLVTAIYNMADTFFVSKIKDVAAPRRCRSGFFNDGSYSGCGFFLRSGFGQFYFKGNGQIK